MAENIAGLKLAGLDSEILPQRNKQMKNSNGNKNKAKRANSLSTIPLGFLSKPFTSVETHHLFVSLE